MQVRFHEEEARALEITLTRGELPLFRAALLRANFEDIPPQMTARTLDFVQELLALLEQGSSPA
jgi:hypothetical protein